VVPGYALPTTRVLVPGVQPAEDCTVTQACCICANPASDSYVKAPLCPPCLRAWAQFQEKPVAGARAYEDFEEAMLREFVRQLRGTRPDLGRRIAAALDAGDRGLDGLLPTLTPEDARYGLGVLLGIVSQVTGLSA